MWRYFWLFSFSKHMRNNCMREKLLWCSLRLLNFSGWNMCFEKTLTLSQKWIWDFFLVLKKFHNPIKCRGVCWTFNVCSCNKLIFHTLLHKCIQSHWVINASVPHMLLALKDKTKHLHCWVTEFWWCTVKTSPVELR